MASSLACSSLSLTHSTDAHVAAHVLYIFAGQSEEIQQVLDEFHRGELSPIVVHASHARGWCSIKVLQGRSRCQFAIHHHPHVQTSIIGFNPRFQQRNLGF
ncbi:unnamed protein product [Victoria cruziana]